MRVMYTTLNTFPKTTTYFIMTQEAAELSDALKSINEAEKQASNLEKMLDDLDRKMDYLLEAMADNKQEADKETNEEAKE
ncbi:hypothetical protein FDK38_005247 [Candidozyma auris]|nr:hypothetical protein FDK38_005247 [[Candida] auris]